MVGSYKRAKSLQWWQYPVRMALGRSPRRASTRATIWVNTRSSDKACRYYLLLSDVDEECPTIQHAYMFPHVIINGAFEDSGPPFCVVDLYLC